MRIIAGELKGRRLQTPDDSEKIRPTSDHVKESIFNMLSPYIEDSLIADIFSGTGNLGIEAVSRGAKHAFFGDISRKSLALTEKNIKLCGIMDRSTLLQGEWQQVLKRLPQEIDVFFLDPPYRAGIMTDCIETIDSLSLQNENGIIVAEHSGKEILPPIIGRYSILKEKRYGSIVITIYTKDAEDI